MLFIESRTLDYRVDGATRVLVLESLQREKGVIPLIHSSRLRCFELALQQTGEAAGERQIKEMENLIAAWAESEENTTFVAGDVFCFDDFVLFLTFGGTREGESPRTHAGVIYGAETAEPLRKLDSFCRDVRDALAFARSAVDGGAKGGKGSSEPGFTVEWRRGKPRVPAGFARFITNQDIDSLYTAVRKETRIERQRAAMLLEDTYSRLYLRRVREAHTEGCATKLLTTGKIETSEDSIDKLFDVGLIRHEVLVSCRKTGHALFHLPTPDSLAVVTVSEATCSECGAPVADEKIEEVITPTDLATMLLEDGAWLINRLYSILRKIGIPESEIAIGPVSEGGEAHIMANVCGESFLFVLRDGDLTTAAARRVIDMEIETEAPHVVIVATGEIHDEGRVRLFDHARRRMRSGNEIEVMIVDGTDTAAVELRHAFERVSQRVIAEQLSKLDASAGLSVSRVVISRFELMRKIGSMKELAESSIEVTDLSLIPKTKYAVF